MQNEDNTYSIIRFSQSADFVATIPQSDAQGSEKVVFQILLWHLLGTMAALWSHVELGASTESQHCDFTDAQ